MKTTTTKTPRNSNQTTLSAFAAALLAAFTFNTTAQAVDYTWDPTSGDSAITEGAGNWDTTTTNWTTDVGVTNTNAPAGAFTSDLIFGGGTLGTAGTVTLTETGNDYGSIEFLATNAGTYDIDLNGNIVNIRRSAQTFRALADATISDSAGGGELRHDTSQYRDDGTGSTLSISAVVADRGTAVVRTYESITLDLSGVNTYTGNTELYNSSTLRISGAGQLGSGTYAGNITLNDNADFEYASSADQTLSGVISDDAGIGEMDVIMSGSGTLTLTGTNTYTGDTTINSGTLEIQNSEALGTGLVRLNGGGELQFGADALDLSENVRSQNAGDSRTIRLDLAGTNTGTLSGQLDIRNTGAGNFSIDVGADDTLSVTSVIIGAGSAGLTKEGDGTLIIEANSEYTGATTVNGGTLEISATAGNNSPDSASYQINNGSTLFLNETTANNLILGVGIGDITFGSSDPGGTLQLNGNTIFRNQTITTTGGAKNFITGGTFNLQNSRNITFDTAVGTDGDGIDLEVSATISGGDIIKDGAGTVSLTNSANNLGTQNGGGAGEINTVTINAGTLEIGGAGRLVNGNYAGAISNDGTFKYNSTNDQTLSGVISGTGAVVKDNSGTLTLSGDNDYTGNTTVSNGTLKVANNSALGTSAAGTVVNSGATLDLNAGVNIASEALTLSGNLLGRTNGGDSEYGGAITLGAAASISTGGSGNFTVSGNVDGAGNQLTLDNQSATISVTGNITGTSTSLVKQGDAEAILSGANTYTGATTVSAGTLALSHASLNNIISSSSIIDVAGGATLDVSALGGGLGGLELASGQTLQGSGTVSGGLTVGDGAVLSPGNSPGTQNHIGDLTWSDGGTYLWEINDSGGTKGADPGWDWISITGDLQLGGLSADGFTIDIDSLDLASAPGLADGFTGFDGYPVVDISFIIATADNIVGFDANNFVLDSSGFQNGGYWEIREDTGDLILDFYAVPEPSSTALLGLGGLALMLRRKRS